jgi:hypothetical protein
MGKKIHRLEVYEVSYHHGIELLLGSFLIQKLSHPTKIIISDFDKTLVDTKYSSPREMYQSLRNPLSYFPKIETSIHLLKKYIKKDYHPFILSASPHFYEKPFRDWLYQNGIFTGNIFLKDYKKILSLNESELSFKDIKKQGFYKLNHLVDILLMTGIPDELILMGDGFESDTIIYLVLRSILIENLDPHFIWKSVKELKTFGFNTKQQAKFLIKFNQLAGQIHKKKTQKMKIFIRCKESFYHKVKEFSYNVSFLDQQKEHISFYCA